MSLCPCMSLCALCACVCVYVYICVCMCFCLCEFVYEHMCLCMYACFKYTEVSTVILIHHKHPSYPAMLKRWFLFMGFFYSQHLCITEEPNTGLLIMEKEVFCAWMLVSMKPEFWIPPYTSVTQESNGSVPTAV